MTKRVTVFRLDRLQRRVDQINGPDDPFWIVLTDEEAANLDETGELPDRARRAFKVYEGWSPDEWDLEGDVIEP